MSFFVHWKLNFHKLNTQGARGTDGEKGDPGEPGRMGLPGKNVCE